MTATNRNDYSAVQQPVLKWLLREGDYPESMLFDCCTHYIIPSGANIEISLHGLLFLKAFSGNTRRQGTVTGPGEGRGLRERLRHSR